MKSGKGRFHEHFPHIRFVSRKAIFGLFRLFSSNCQQVYKTIRSNPGQHPVNFVRRARSRTKPQSLIPNQPPTTNNQFQCSQCSRFARRLLHFAALRLQTPPGLRALLKALRPVGVHNLTLRTSHSLCLLFFVPPAVAFS